MLRTLAGLWSENDRSFGRLLVAAMLVGFLGLAGVGYAAWRVTAENRSHGSWVQHTYEVQAAIAEVELYVERSETTRRGYLLTGMPVYRGYSLAYQAQLGRWLDQVASLTRDNADQHREMRSLRADLAAIAAQRRRSFDLVASGRRTDALAAFEQETSLRRMQGVRRTLGRMTATERQLLEMRDQSLRDSQDRFNLILLAAGILLALVATSTLFAVLRYTRDIDRSRAALRRLNDTLEDEVAERTSDLSRANEEIQRFAYIVSHDLRSPLVNVMGFTAELAAATGPLGTLIDRVEAEAPALLTEEARLAIREDLPESVGFIRASTQKMDRLINAILKLSREGRRTVAPEPLDIAAIADAAVAAIQHVVDDRGVTVAVVRPMPPVTSDRLAVEQILSNLIENATKYLQAGRPGRITVSAARTPRGRVVVSVADNGRGIDPADHQRIFDLFRRSGVQDQPGEGIGLAHVRALAYRLGGTIDVESRLGEGATFRLDLPAAYQSPADAKDKP